MPPVPRGFSTLSIRARAPFPCFLVEKRSGRFRARSAPHDAAGRTSGSRHRSMRDGTARCVKAKLHRDRVFRRQPSFASNHRRPFDGVVDPPRLRVASFVENMVLATGARAFASGDWRLWVARHPSPHVPRIDANGAVPTCAVDKARSTRRALPTVRVDVFLLFSSLVSFENIVVVHKARAFASGDWRLWAARAKSPHRGKNRPDDAVPTCAVHKARSTPRALPTVRVDGFPKEIPSAQHPRPPTHPTSTPTWARDGDPRRGRDLRSRPWSVRARIRRLALVGRAPEVTAPRQGSTPTARCQLARSTKPGARRALCRPCVSMASRKISSSAQHTRPPTLSDERAHVGVTTRRRLATKATQPGSARSSFSFPERARSHQATGACGPRDRRSSHRGKNRRRRRGANLRVPLSTPRSALVFLSSPSRTSFSFPERARSHQATGACGPRARSHRTEARIDATGAVPTCAVHKARSTPLALPTVRADGFPE